MYYTNYEYFVFECKKNDGEHLLDITHKKYHLIEYANSSFAKVSHFVSVAATPANWSP